MTPQKSVTTASTSLLTSPDGRTLAVDVAGPADGPTVLLLSAAPGSRRFDPDPAATAAAGVRLVTLDRPGYGGSSPLPAGTPLTIPLAADDAAFVLGELGVTDAGVVGWSAGGRVAMALAARHPRLTRAVAVVATPAPDEEVGWIGEDEKQMIAAMPSDPAEAQTTLTGMLTPMTEDRPAWTGMVSGGPADEKLLAAPGVRARLEEMLAEAFRQGASGLAADILSYTVQPWGFDARAVGAPVTCWYGAEDAGVTPAHGRWWAARADGSLRVVDGVGHLVVAAAWAEILADVGGATA